MPFYGQQQSLDLQLHWTPAALASRAMTIMAGYTVTQDEFAGGSDPLVDLRNILGATQQYSATFNPSYANLSAAAMEDANHDAPNSVKPVATRPTRRRCDVW